MEMTYISSYSTCTSKCSTVVVFLAGILTFRNNFEAAAVEIAKKYHNVKIVVHFPYGMADGKARSSYYSLLARQLGQAGYDLTRERSSRVIQTARIIHEHADKTDQLILIGHSAGGVIAYRAGLDLEKQYGHKNTQVFAVGCPKFYLKDISYNDRFTYITGQNLDRITTIGRWRKPGSRVYSGRPGREVKMDFNPVHQGWRFHASYFLNSAWSDANEIFHSNSEDLIRKIHELCPGI